MTKVIFLSVLVLFSKPVFSEVIPLHPEEEGIIFSEDLLVVFSLFSTEELSQNKYKMLWDEEDISSQTTVTSRYIKFVPNDQFKRRLDVIGKHIVTIQILNNNGELLEQSSLPFTVLHSRPTTTLSDKELNPLQTAGRLGMNVRYESYAGSRQTISDNTLWFRAAKDLQYVTTHVYFTSNEDKRLQPRSRFNITYGYGKEYKFGIGDNYPSYHPLVLTSTRVRGVEFRLQSEDNVFKTVNLNMVYGLSRMGSENLGFTSKGIKETGIYKRRIFAFNPSIGRGEKFKLGLVIMKAKDDAGSIPQDADSLNRIKGSTPQDNLVIGTEMLLGFGNRNVVLFGNYAFGLVTEDIRGGPITGEQIARFVDTSKFPESVIEEYKGAFVINSSTSLKSPSGRALLNSSVYEAGVRLKMEKSLFTSYTEVSYLRLGPNYHSLGQPYLGEARKGTYLSEKLMLFKGMLFLSGRLGLFEKGQAQNYDTGDNSIAITPTLAKDYTVSLLYNPTKYLPRLSLSFSNNATTNADTSALLKKDDQNEAITFSAGYSLPIKFVRNSLAFNIGTVNNSFTSGTNYDSQLYSFNLTTIYGDLPFSTSMAYTTNGSNNSIAAKYSIVNAGVRYDILPQIVQTSLSIGQSRFQDQNKVITNVKWGLTYLISNSAELEMLSMINADQQASDIYSNLHFSYNF